MFIFLSLSVQVSGKKPLNIDIPEVPEFNCIGSYDENDELPDLNIFTAFGVRAALGSVMYQLSRLPKSFKEKENIDSNIIENKDKDNNDKEKEFKQKKIELLKQKSELGIKFLKEAHIAKIRCQDSSLLARKTERVKEAVVDSCNDFFIKSKERITKICEYFNRNYEKKLKMNAEKNINCKSNIHEEILMMCDQLTVYSNGLKRDPAKEDNFFSHR